MPVLTPNNATITTAMIEVAVLRLDKRQVTQAVFRQIPERSPIAADGGLITGAVPWGLVNYWWDGAGHQWRAEQTLHLLWQLDTGLYRAPLVPVDGASTRRLHRRVVRTASTDTDRGP